MKKLPIILLLSIFVFNGCWWMYVPNKHRLTEQDFEYYSPDFEKTSDINLKATSLRFDGFYYKKYPLDVGGIKWEIRKFFRNGMVNEGDTWIELQNIGDLYNHKQYAYGFYKFLQNDVLVAEIRNLDFPKHPRFTTYYIQQDKLIEITSEGDTLKFEFYYEPKASLYPE